MQRKKIFPLFFLFLFLSVLATSLIPQVKATINYEWIQNRGFEDARGGQYFHDCENLNFWDLSDELTLNSTVKAQGNSSINVINNYIPYHQYNITNMNNIPYNSTTVLGAWFYMPIGTPDSYQGGDIVLRSNGLENNIQMGLGYSSGAWHYHFAGYSGDTPFSYNLGTYTLGDWVWLEMAFYDNNNVTYYADGAVMGTYADSTYYLFGQYDNLTCYTYLQAYDLFNVDYIRVSNSEEYPPQYVSVGQTTITPYTSPWHDNDIYNTVTSQGIIINGTAHSGICSFYDDGSLSGYPIFQQFNNYLYSNSVTNTSIYAMTQNSINTTVRYGIRYSDGSTTYKDMVVHNDGNWHLLNFTEFILPNHLITGMYLMVLTGTLRTYIDDVSLFSTFPVGQSIFDWELSPSAISYPDNLHFRAYQRQGYTFVGYVYDVDGNLNENGTFTQTNSMSSSSGIITSGIFTFPIPARLSTNEFTETFFIVINTTSGTTFNINIHGTWIFVAVEEPTDYDSWYSNMVVTYMILFIFIIVPPLIIAFEFAKHDVDPFMGFVGGLCLTVPIAYIVNIIDLWVLFVFVLGLILMVLSKLGAFNRF